jgi:L-asparaginase/beta-aspartyl-peptidase (threonine type)
MTSGPGSGRSVSGAIGYGVVVHGGVGSSGRLKDPCAKICRQAFLILEKGGHALDAVVEAVRLLEDDGRFNAGSGSVLRLDGRTVEMDASVMDSSGRLGAVVALREAKNPVLVAKAVTDTPHVMLAGTGADLLARKLGFEPPGPPSLKVVDRYRKTLRMLQNGRLSRRDRRWTVPDVEKWWNFPTGYEEVFPLDTASSTDRALSTDIVSSTDTVFSTDTVGAVAIDGRGRLAVASSTGGASPMMLGRVGDTAVVGAGFYVGEKAAIAATGIGEEILRKVLARSVYDSFQGGTTIVSACENEIGRFPRSVPVGVIAISRAGYAIVANRRMAAYALFKEACGEAIFSPSSSLSCE